MVLAAVISRLADERLGERPLTETGTRIPLASGLRSSSGSLAKMAAMCCASSRVSSSRRNWRRGSFSKYT